MRCAYKSCTIWSSTCNPNFKQIHLSNQSVKIFPRTSLSQLEIPLSNAYRVPLLWPSALYPAAIQRLCLFSCFVELAFPSFERIIMQSQCTTAYQIIATIPLKLHDYYARFAVVAFFFFRWFGTRLQFSLTLSCVDKRDIQAK